MTRSVSNRSESNMPFVQTGPVAPLTNPAMDRFYTSRDEPANQSLQGGLSQRLPNVQENTPFLDFGMDPDVFLAQWDEKQQVTEPYISPQSDISPNGVYMYPMTPACPSMVSGSSAAENASPLTRQNSSFDNLTAAEMGRLASSQSQAEVFFAKDSHFVNGLVTGSKRPAEQVLFGLGASLSPTPPDQYASSAPNGTSFLSSPDSTNMERSNITYQPTPSQIGDSSSFGGGRRGSAGRGDIGSDVFGGGRGKTKNGRKRKYEEEESGERKFACPFYKYDRQAFMSSRTCVGPGWYSVHRVKSVTS